MINKPSIEEAENAVRTLLAFIGEDIHREGLIDTPKRVVKSYAELFSGYGKDPAILCDKQFHEVGNFKDLILLKNIKFKSFCEHHMLPFQGYVDIAYVPNNSVVGVSKLARIVKIFAARLQIQEKMTANIAESLQNSLSPLGVAIKISAIHSCMTMRGVMQEESVMETMHYTGIFEDNIQLRKEFLSLTSGKSKC
jgi:GTP cyclohydrolase I